MKSENVSTIFIQSLQALKSGIENVSANGRIAKAQLDRLIGKSK